MPSAANRPSILVVEDDAAFREHVRVVLEGAGFGVVEASSGEDALLIASESEPSLILLDVHLPGFSGYEICRTLRQNHGDRIGIIFLSGSKTDSIDRAAGLGIGADDYVLKPFEPDELVARVRAVLRRMQPRGGEAATASNDTFHLTPRELEILGLLADGLTQDQIAERLVIAPKTVATHIERILSKLGVQSRAQAVALAFREELVGMR
ncbi:MAG TPA: response regulator transcription factor [Gaiellaceae bacterium]|nr:response regulator transcription factor [Gaiellaceae bacterium]